LIEQALLQRARLLERLAQDVYGAQTTLQGGGVPAALTWGHSAWQPCLHQIQPRGQRWLGMLSFEVGQDAQGQCWVLRSSTSDRHALAQALGQHHDALTQAWLAHWRGTWHVPSGENAACVIMSSIPQPDRSTDWGNLWWASSNDLQVRSGRLHVQRPNGWQPVHGLICETDLDANDPLEGTEANLGGVAGLFSCIRQHTLSVLNMPGLRFLDEAAWAAFWPNLCQQLLGEPLMLPSPASWWLGEDNARQQAQSLTCAAWLRPHDAMHAGQPTPTAMLMPEGNQARREAAWTTALLRPEGWTLQQHLQIEATWRVGLWCGQPGPAGIVQTEAWSDSRLGGSA
jgi:hypothetical protein